MNKNDIKQIILEEIEFKLQEIAGGINIGGTFEEDEDGDDEEITPPGPEDMPGAITYPFSTDTDIRIRQLIEPLAIALYGLDPVTGDLPTPTPVTEMPRKSETWYATPKMNFMVKYFVGQGGEEGLVQAMIRINDVLKRTQNVGFKSRAKKYQTLLFLDQEGNLDINKVRGFARLLLNPEGFTQKDIQSYVGFKNSAQANAFKIKLYKAKLIDLKPVDPSERPNMSESKKKLNFDLSQVNTPEKLPIDVEEQDLMDNIKKELKSSAEDYQNDGNKKTADKLKDAVSWVDKNGLKGKATLEQVHNFLTKFHNQLPENDKMFLHEPTILELIEDEFKPYVETEEEYQKIVFAVKQYLSSKQSQTMSELEKYIKKVIKEAKNPLAKKMKEIEQQGRKAALETKLAAIDEMIEETEGRLTRIDEDNEFRDMMDKNAVKEVRKQLKELERAKAKLQKEYGKMGKMGLPKNYDEDEKKVMDEESPVDEVANEFDETLAKEVDAELEEGTLNEISADLVTKAIFGARDRGEFKRANDMAQTFMKNQGFIGKETPTLGKLDKVMIVPNDAAIRFDGLSEVIDLTKEPLTKKNAPVEKIILSFTDSKAGFEEMQVVYEVFYDNLQTGGGRNINELELDRADVRLLQTIVKMFNPGSKYAGPGTSNYRVAGLRESDISRMKKLANIIQG